MKKYPNQKTITIKKETVAIEPQKPFLTIYVDTLNQAAANLSHVGLMVYLYLSANAPGYQMALSPKNIINNFAGSISASSIQRGIRELIEKSYLVENSGSYDFFSKPQEKGLSS